MTYYDTWSKPNIDGLIARKRIDKSMLVERKTHIDKKVRDYFLKTIGLGLLKEGPVVEINLIIDDYQVTGKLTIDSNDRVKLTFSTEIKDKLKEVFKYSNKILIDENNSDVKVDEFIDFFYTEKPNTFRVKFITHGSEFSDNNETVAEENYSEISTSSKTIVENIHTCIFSKGYFYTLDTIKNLYLSLKTKPFAILAGISGTGKSKLVELFAEALGATFDNGRYSLISVRPDWSDPTDLLGYKNIEGKFQPGPLTTIIERAVNDKENRPYFICLDEMNLARVEYYFSDVLSIMETRKSINGIIKTQGLFKEEVFGEDEDAKSRFGSLYIPSNLYIIGTVNMDETTFPFSKKVLDRANTIEFNEVDLDVDFESIGNFDDINELNVRNTALSSKYLKIVDCVHEKDNVKTVIEELKVINKELEELNLHFGYRVRDEICFYVLYAIEEDLMDINKALDHAILQKVLPRLQGNSITIKNILVSLFNKFNGAVIKTDTYDNEISEHMAKYLNSKTKGENSIKYPLTSYKICKMVRRYELDGFTTFWE